MPEVVNKRRFGDRKDGRLLRSLAPFYKLIPYIMKEKSDACNQFSDSVEIGEAETWIRAKRAEGYKGMGILHLFIASYVRTVAHCPGLNRFIGGQKIYARNNIEVVMAVKKTLSTDGNETTIKFIFEPTDTIFDIYRKISAKIDEVKAMDDGNNTEQAAGAFMKLPGFFVRFAMWCLNVLEYFGLMPQALLDASPFHGSMIITDLGSLGIPPIYHHIYNFGNLPLFIAFGAKHKVTELDKSGTPVERKYVDYKVVMDERIADGFYYASAFKFMKYYLKNPAALEIPPESVKEDVF